jgi:hypothetical protein
MSAKKKIHRNSVIGQQGVNLIEKVVLGMGYVWYPTGGTEAGIDGSIEIRNPETGEVNNSIVQVQSKATANLFQGETESGFDYRCSEKDLDYWMQGNAPVILVVSRPQAGEAYWVSVKDYFADPKRRAARKVRFDKARDRFDEGSAEALAELAVPRDAGVYFAPSPTRETLHSNLLKVSHFPGRLYVGETHYRDGKEIRARLREHGADEDNEWFPKRGSVYSFNDLSEEPWDEICDQGTVEAFHSEEWAYSDDPDRQREFVQLLNQCLRAKAVALGLRYSKDLECHYFGATNDLSELKLGYQSLVNETSRTVFCGYEKKGSQKGIAYYRHSAFKGWFQRFGDDWYLEITPTYYFTWDGWRLDRFYEDRLRKIKEQEKNPAVRGQVVMWAEYLSRDGNLFEPQYPMLGFGELMRFEVEAGLDDAAWLERDEESAGDRASGDTGWID